MSTETHTGSFAVRRKSVKIDGVKIFYRDTESSGPLILCLHGRFGRGETWMDLIGHYSNRFRLVAPDQRGHGLSDQPHSKYTSEEIARDAAALVAHLDCGPAIVIGHSMGGRVAGYLAAIHPEAVSALVILDQTARGPTSLSVLPLHELPPKDNFTADWPLPFSSYAQAREYLLTTTQSAIRAGYYLDSLVERDDGYHMLFSQQATSAIFEYQQDWFHLHRRRPRARRNSATEHIATHSARTGPGFRRAATSGLSTDAEHASGSTAIRGIRARTPCLSEQSR